MRLVSSANSEPVHLTYCANVHPGERLCEVRAALETHVLSVKRQVSPDAPFGIGLRLSATAARELSDPAQLSEFRAFLSECGLYVFTLNAFPYGSFHAARVKEQVYAPDWRSPERRAYSDQCAELLAAMLPEGMEGSVSTVPLGFRPELEQERARALCVEQLLQHALRLVQLERETGKRLALALEPEPFCALETVEETVSFFERWLFASAGVARFAALLGEPPGRAETLLRTHLGVCLDACHLAVAFEAPTAAVARLRAAGVRVPKVQISAGLELSFETFTPALDHELARFADEVYLHQVFERSAAGSARYLDLDDALSAVRSDAQRARTLRVHFHVPVFAATLGLLGSTQAELKQLLLVQRASPISAHLEVETYTWNVLPAQYQNEPVAQAIARELRWTRAELGA